MERFKGIIALDIDGTITVERDRLDPKVSAYLSGLIADGWRLVFVTGRTFSFAESILQQIEGEFFFAVQNGAALYAMPGEQLVQKHYVDRALLHEIVRLHPQILVESGRQNGDICYYCPRSFTEKEREYLAFRDAISPEKWVALDTLDELPVSECAVVKYFASEGEANAIAAKIGALGRVVVIRDPFNPGEYLAHVNAPGASKGEVLTPLVEEGFPLIAAGDDLNDVEMLERSTVKIVMETAPEQMHALADIVAPSAAQHGIIKGLKEAIDGRDYQG